MTKKLHLYCDELGRQPDVSSSVSFPFQYYYDGNKFVMLNGFTLTRRFARRFGKNHTQECRQKVYLKHLRLRRIVQKTTLLELAKYMLIY